MLGIFDSPLKYAGRACQLHHLEFFVKIMSILLMEKYNLGHFLKASVPPNVGKSEGQILSESSEKLSCQEGPIAVQRPLFTWNLSILISFLQNLVEEG